MIFNIDSILEELYNLQRLGIKVGLDHTIELLKAIGNPHENLKLIHIAGTNGKGSTCSILSNILIEHGFKVGLYTSPHLKKFNERIQINGHQIPDLHIASFFKDNRELIKSIEATFFEYAVRQIIFDLFFLLRIFLIFLFIYSNSIVLGGLEVIS